jgi:hypothetical protein
MMSISLSVNFSGVMSIAVEVDFLALRQPPFHLLQFTLKASRALAQGVQPPAQGNHTVTPFKPRRMTPWGGRDRSQLFSRAGGSPREGRVRNTRPGGGGSTDKGKGVAILDYALGNRPSTGGREVGGRLCPQRARRQLVPVVAIAARPQPATKNASHSRALSFFRRSARPASAQRLHKAHKLTPAMAAGITDKLWSVEDIVALVEAREPKPAKRGPYKKRIAA